MEEFAHFAPWRRALRRLVREHDEDEPAAGALREKLRCLRVDFCILEFLYEEDEPRNATASFGDWKRVYLVRLREAVELIGLLLHYDKRAWRWFLGPDDFDYESDELEPHSEFSFHDTVLFIRGDRVDDVADGIEVLTRIDSAQLSEKYHVARDYLRVIVEIDNYDSEYRVPVSFVLAPDKYVGIVGQYCAAVREFAWDVHNASRADAPLWFDFIGMTLYIWRLRVNEAIVTLLSNLRLAQIHLLEVDVNLVNTREIHSGKTTNLISRLGALNDGTVNCYADAVGLH